MSMVQSIKAECLRHKALAEAAMRQVPEDELSRPGPNGGNSIAVMCWHMSGNFRSRFTDFLTTDGEKPWRAREEEFLPRTVPREELLARWDEGWAVILGVLEDLRDDQLSHPVVIRGETHTVHEALHRALSHVAYHVGQIVYLAKEMRGNQWVGLGR
jgi:uncharacterized damage-inducible protein DinB